MLTTAIETSVMPKRGPYKKSTGRAPAPQWRRIFLAQWRNLRGMTQEQLAEAAGVSVGLVSSLEAGNAGYSAESLHKLATALKIEPGMILSVNPESDEALWSLFLRASTSEREQIAKHAAVILGPKRSAKR